MSQIIRMVIAVEVPEGQDPQKIARELREAKAGSKIQSSLAHVVAPNAVEGADDIKVVDHEHFTHVCDWYTQDECNYCRRASSYSLQRTQDSFFS